MASTEQFCDLHRVQCRALSQIVRSEQEAQRSDGHVHAPQGEGKADTPKKPTHFQPAKKTLLHASEVMLDPKLVRGILERLAEANPPARTAAKLAINLLLLERAEEAQQQG